MYVASQIIILIILDPLGGTVLRFQLSFESRALAEIMAGWGNTGIKRFLDHFYLDFLHPVMYGSFLFFILYYLKLKLPDKANPGRIPAYCYLPVTAAVFDLIENILELVIIHWRTDIPEGLAFMNGLVSSSKWALAAASMLAVAVLGAKIALRSIQAMRSRDMGRKGDGV